MIREIIKSESGSMEGCNDIDVTLENGKYHCPGLQEGLIRDLVDTMKHDGNLNILVASEIGYSSRVLVLKNQKGFVPLLNPVKVKTSGHRQKFCDEMVYQKIRVKFWSIDGKQYQINLGGNDGRLVQLGLKKINN